MTPPATVVVGVIDDGIAFAHHRFRNGLNTRVENWWLQDGAPNTSTVPYGLELTKAQIDVLIAACSSGGALDEERFYAEAGLNNFRLEGHKTAAWRIAHGTHVMDLVCGYDRPPPYGQRIIAVQLPARVTADPSGALLPGPVLDAIRYIIDRADSLSHPNYWPIVINLSYGFFAGPHDGLHELEDAIDSLVATRSAVAPLVVVLPAGNSFLSCTHAQASFNAINQAVTLNWRVLPDNRAPSFLEIWLPYRNPPLGPSRVEVTIAPPGGPAGLPLGETPALVVTWHPNGPILSQMEYAVRMPSNRGQFVLFLQPTADPDGAVPIAPAGTWTVTIKNLGLNPGEIVHAWIQRDDSLYGHPRRGRQSRFDDPQYQRYDDNGQIIEVDNALSHVRRDGTISAIATGDESIVAGGYLGNRTGAVRYSSSGPTTPALGAVLPYRDGPDALTISEDSFNHRGVLAAGSRSGSTVAMGGTSVASAQVARICARELGAGRPADRTAIKAIVDADEFTPFPTPRPSLQRGYGRIWPNPVRPLPR